MPAPIAERLKSGEERIADRIETLSVMFADLVGFTAAVHHLPPEEVVDFLDRLVRVFDGLEREIRRREDQDHRRQLHGGGRLRRPAARRARWRPAGWRWRCSTLSAASRRSAAAALQLRIGIHCGPATAGVIGDTRFSYDVWGDAVNMAARMESNGEPGKIHVSEDFRALTLDRFEFEDAAPPS